MGWAGWPSSWALQTYTLACLTRLMRSPSMWPLTLWSAPSSTPSQPPTHTHASLFFFFLLLFFSPPSRPPLWALPFCTFVFDLLTLTYLRMICLQINEGLGSEALLLTLVMSWGQGRNLLFWSLHISGLPGERNQLRSGWVSY